MVFIRHLILALALLAPLPALAQSSEEDTAAEAQTITNGQTIGAWTVNCVAVAVGQTNCTLTQRILRSTDGAFVADIVALRDAEQNTYLLARVPVGASLPAGFAMRQEDSEDMMPFTWQVCTPDVCEALLPVDAELAETLSAEDNIMIAAFRPTLQSDPFVFQLSLNGMNTGLDALSN